MNKNVPFSFLYRWTDSCRVAPIVILQFLFGTKSHGREFSKSISVDRFRQFLTVRYEHGFWSCMVARRCTISVHRRKIQIQSKRLGWHNWGKGDRPTFHAGKADIEELRELFEKRFEASSRRSWCQHQRHLVSTKWTSITHISNRSQMHYRNVWWSLDWKQRNRLASKLKWFEADSFLFMATYWAQLIFETWTRKYSKCR